MKKVSLSIFLVVLTIALSMAQDFPLSWKGKFSIDPSNWYYDDNGQYVLGRNAYGAEMLDGATGKVLWKLNFNNDLKVKKLERATYNFPAGVILFYNGDEKSKIGEKIVVDFKTGKELWRGDKYSGVDADDYFHFAHCVGDLTNGDDKITVVFDNSSKKILGLDVRSGSVKWESTPFSGLELSKAISFNVYKNNPAYIEFLDNQNLNLYYIKIATGEIVKDAEVTLAVENKGYSRYSSNYAVINVSNEAVNVKLIAQMKKSAVDKVKFTLQAQKPSSWRKEFEGTAVRQIYSETPYVKLSISDDKIFVLSKKISVFDLNTGNLLWETPFDNCDASAGLKAKQEFGIAGWPVTDKNNVYYVDLKTDNAIKKVDAKTGQLVWKTESFKSNDRVPDMVIMDNVLVAQFGGMINVQKFIPNPNGGYGSGTYKNENRFDGNFGLRAYDLNTGSLIWSTDKLQDKLGDKFDKRISNILSSNGKIFAASSQNLFCLDPKTGAVAFKTNISASKIGDVFEIKFSGNNIIAFCDKGVAALNAADGKLIYATKTDPIFWEFPGAASYYFSKGDNQFLWVGEKDFIGFDFTTGKIKGKMKDNTNPQMTEDGNYIFLRDGANISKFAVNGK